MSRKSEASEVKKIIRSLLISAKHGLTVNELSKEYHSVAFKPLPFRELGYSSAMEFIKDIPDVVKPCHGPGGVIVLHGIPDESTQHLHSMIRRQKSTGRNTKLLTPQAAEKRKAPVKPLIPNVIRVRLKDLLSSYSSGIDASLLSKAYEKRFGYDLNYQQLGYSSIKQLLQELPDILKLVPVGSSGFSVYPVKEVIPQAVSLRSAKSCNDRDQSEDGKSDSSTPRALMEVEPCMISKCGALPGTKPNHISERNATLDVHFKASTIKTAISEQLRQQIRDLLLKLPSGIWAARFSFMYKDIYRKELDLHSLGFTSVVELMATLPDLVTIERPTANGDWILRLNAESTLSMKATQTKPEVPDDAASGDAKFGLIRISDEIEMMKVYVTHIVNPSEFWVQWLDVCSDLDKLMDKMRSFYVSLKSQNFYLLPASHIRVGQICCALYKEDQEWYRAKILYLPGNNMAKVLYVDYGNEAVVQTSCLRLLKREFIYLPEQAIRVCLGDLSPAGSLGWTVASTRRFFELVDDKPLFAKVLQKATGMCPMSVELIDTTEAHDVYVNRILVAEGHALKRTSSAINNPAVTGKEDVGMPAKQSSLAAKMHGSVLGSVHVASAAVAPFSEGHHPVRETAVVAPEKRVSAPQSKLKRATSPALNLGIARSALDGPVQKGNACVPQADDLVPQASSLGSADNKILVKRLLLPEQHRLHVVCYDDRPYVISGEISGLLWDEDVLRLMLRQKKMNFVKETLAREDEQELFDELVSLEAKGIVVNGKVRDCISLYAFDSVPTILHMFRMPSPKAAEIMAVIAEEVQRWRDSPATYWHQKEEKSDLDLTDSECLELELEAMRNMIHALQFRRKRIFLSMMTNTASPTAVDEVKKIEEEIEDLRRKMDAKKLSA